MDLKLKDKVALVTGGSHGLGKASCLALAAEGAKVAVNYRRNPEKTDAVIAEIQNAHGTRAIGSLADVAVEDDVRKMFDQIEAELGPVDVLINNAAVCPTCQVKDMDVEEWTHTVHVNMTGTFLTCKQMVGRLIAADRIGRIVNISSQAAFRGSTTGHAPYDASKGGIVAFTVSLAREVCANNIAVNSVAPGMMFTEMTAKTLTANPDKYLNRIPLHRIGDPAEIAAVTVFLASEKASYMTGACVDVSGGMLMR
ncbi:MAG: SDR family oxidoreductase [Planctomycetes bacterium]|nr:SDR family oxidoreductase [Planctomycetota bacterium]